MAEKNIWGEELDVSSNVEKNKQILKKVKEPKEPKVVVEKQIKSKNISTEERIRLITEKVNQVLGKQKDNVIVIKTKEDLRDYISESISNDIIAIDTETNNSLDPITCKLMGLCLFTPNNKQAYVPVNHIDHTTGEKLPWQLTEQDIQKELERLVYAQPLIIMHNAKFDYQVLKMTCGVEVPCYWDTLIAAKLINENELASLKNQYILHVDPEQEKYAIESLFEKQDYAIFPPELFALYSATDAYMTYKLYEWQKTIMDSQDYAKIKSLFSEIEMPCVRVVAEMELAGVELDMEYASRLSTKYHKKLDEIDSRINAELETYKDKIEAWRLTPEANIKPAKKSGNGEGKSKSEQLLEPINLGSPTQLAILLYDVIGIAQVSKKSPRGTGEDILKSINLPLCELILERRGTLKLLDAFIDSLPKQVNPVDGRIHGHFNQYGAATGRFSSSNPNLQQMPSSNKEIRMMFKAKDGYTFVGSDFSQQEPRLLSNYSRDENMINAYKDGKDLYATIASGIYKNNYEDNLETRPDGTSNPDGKKRRTSVKSILLGIMYGRGAAAIAEQIGGTIQEAQGIIDTFYQSFPSVKSWMDETTENAKKHGYVEDLWGRRRRLSDILLPRFEITDILGGDNVMFNPFIGCMDRPKENQKVKKYYDQLAKVRGRKDIDFIISQAAKDNVKIKDNGGFISQAERQCVNARIQGGAATMTKIAMNKLFRDKELKELGFRLLIGVHDELIGECPKENAEAVAERMTYIMKTCIDDVCVVPFKCDADICDHWYYNDYSSSIKKEYKENLKRGMTEEEAFDAICLEHSEMKPDELRKIVV